MTALNGYIEGLGSGADRIVRKTGKEVRLSVFDNIDDVIVFNQEGETTQTTLTGKNLFNKDDSSLILTGYLTSEGLFANGGEGVKTICLAVDASTTYTISKIQSARFRIGTYSAIPTYNDTINNLVMNDNATSLTVTTGASDSYLLAFIYNSGSDTLTLPQILDTVQIEKRSTPTDYEPYCGGVPSPNPSYPQAVEGIGFKRPDGTYSVSISYDDGDEHYGVITASGLAYPLYEGDILDFANGKVIRAKGYKKFDGSTETGWYAYTSGSGYAIPLDDMKNGTRQFGYCSNFTVKTAPSSDNNIANFGLNTNHNLCFINVNISGVTDLASWKTWLSNNNVTVVYPLANPVEEYITIEGGDIADIGTARVIADGTLRIKYDKAEMAIRKYSAKPDWQKIGYTDTPQIILDAFDYSKQIYDTWTSAASYASKFRGDKALKFFPEVDITGATNYSAMFQESGILSTSPLTIGDGSNTVINSQCMFQTTPIEKIELTTSEATQKVQIANIFNGCTMLKNAKLTLSASGSMQYAFADCNRLERIEDGLETSDVTSFSEAFRACSSLLYLYELDLSSCTTCYRAFYNCTSLYSAPYLNNIRTGGNFQQMFWNCSSLKVLPLYNLGSPSNLTNMFQGTGSNLEETSRINILVMLAACTYSGTKTLAHLGFTASMYSAASWQALPHYNDFVSAGWSIGYN